MAALWNVADSTVTDYVRAFTSSKVRKQLSSVVGITQDTEEAVTRGPGFALVVLAALVSLVLAVVNLFPFLPLDGGHVLWSVAEKVRGKRVSLTGRCGSSARSASCCSRSWCSTASATTSAGLSG